MPLGGGTEADLNSRERREWWGGLVENAPQVDVHTQTLRFGFLVCVT